MKTEKRIHNIFKECEKARKLGAKMPNPMGKYQYIFSNSKGKISLINELREHNNSPNFWEIYCLKGDLFEDCERFTTKKEAIKKVKEYLDVDELEDIIEEKLKQLFPEKLNKMENKK